MASSYTIQPVESAAHRRLFLELPDQHYRDLPCYVRPNNQELEALFDPQRNQLFAKGGQLARWLLLDSSGRAVGRIAAFVNPTIQAREKQPTGGFGFFECPNDQAAASLLLDTARHWLEAHGMQAMDGPVNFGERDRFWGLLVEGFDRLPVYGMLYHPPYYQQLLEAYGLQVYFRQYTYLVPVNMTLHPRLIAKYEEFSQRPEISFAHASRQNLEKLARDFHHVYSLAWGRHEGVASLSLDQARRIVQKMKPIMDEKLVWFAYKNQEPVAFFIAIPGLNQIFHRTGPNLNWWGKIKFLLERRRWEKRPDKQANAIIYGVVPEFQGSGIDAAMVHVAHADYKARRYYEAELSWIGDFNPKMMTLCRAIGGTICKVHHTYRLYFDPSRPFERSVILTRSDRPAGHDTKPTGA